MDTEEESGQKVNSGEENYPAGNQTHNLPVVSQVFSQLSHPNPIRLLRFTGKSQYLKPWQCFYCAKTGLSLTAKAYS